MAQKSLKSRASRNISTLNNLHLITLVINILFLLLHFLPFRLPLTSSNKTSLLPFFILSIPSFIAEFVLERSGRPKYVNGQMKSAGEDLGAQGLTEYLFDIVWVTWGCLVVVLVWGNWAWLIWVSDEARILKLLGIDEII